jgi:hypothetical protein
MRFMTHCRLACLLGLSAAIGVLSAPVHAEPPTRPLLICVAADAPPLVRQSADDILKAASSSPLMSTLAAQGASIADSATLVGDPKKKAYAHLILVGLPNDPLIQLAWQREALVEGPGMYVFDFGHFTGNIGYIESDRNPFLHSFVVKVAPYEAEAITITGTTPEGVAAATQAFLTKGLINGVVDGGAWQRPRTSLLDRDPLPANFTLPAFVPATAGDATLIAVTQGGESEYRGVLQDAGVEPQELWRFKYYLPGAWDAADGVNALQNYLAGLHRRAFGNTLWAARFANAAEAGAAMAKIGEAAHLQLHGDKWVGKVAPTTPKMPPTTVQPRILWQHQEWLLMSTLDQVNPTTVQ